MIERIDRDGNVHASGNYCRYSDAAGLQTRISVYESELKHVHNDFAYCQELNAGLLVERDQLRSQLSDTQNDLKREQENSESLSQEVSRLDNELHQRDLDLASANSNLSQLRTQLASFEAAMGQDRGLYSTDQYLEPRGDGVVAYYLPSTLNESKSAGYHERITLDEKLARHWSSYMGVKILELTPKSSKPKQDEAVLVSDDIEPKTLRKWNYEFFELASKKWPELYGDDDSEEVNKTITDLWKGFCLAKKATPEQVSGGDHDLVKLKSELPLDKNFNSVSRLVCEYLIDRCISLHPSPNKADVPTWQPIDTAPKDGKNILIKFMNEAEIERVVIGFWVAKFSMEDNSDEYEFGEFNEETEMYYWPEGWYENYECHNEYSAGIVTAGSIVGWQPLPPLKDERL